MAVRAVLFDLGDTLIFQAHQPDETALYSAMVEQVTPLLQQWGAGLDPFPLVRDLYQAVEEAQQERRSRGLEVDGSFVTLGALAEHGFEPTPEQAQSLWDASAVSLSLWGWQLFPDTLDTLHKLQDMPVAVGLVSNSYYTTDIRVRLLHTLDLPADLFDAFVLSADLMRPKPRPEPFQRALGLLDVRADEAIFVGDAFDVDIVGAKALGMTTVWKLNGRQEVPPAPEADFMIHDLWELFTLGLLPASGATSSRESPMPHEDGNADRY
jgi:putative hydrolase of the HAD superfamily